MDESITINEPYNDSVWRTPYPLIEPEFMFLTLAGIGAVGIEKEDLERQQFEKSS